MGNFSRNTYDPTKRYVGVRLEQGVPLVDADWNELNDVIRGEVNLGLDLTGGDGVEADTEGLAVSVTAAPDLQVAPGRLLVGGRPLALTQPIVYLSQPWNNAARAGADGVAVIPALTTPAAGRTDVVYLDVWEREVNAIEDTNLINPAIGIETSTRLRREAALRVSEGATVPPAAPAGHSFLTLALLNRQAAQPLAAGQIQDARPFLAHVKGLRTASFAPNFANYSIQATLGVTAVPTTGWFLVHSAPVFTGITVLRVKLRALAPASAQGVLSLYLPQGARMNSLRVVGITASGLDLTMVRNGHATTDDFQFLAQQTVAPTAVGTQTPFDRTFAILAEGKPDIVDNANYYYCLYANAANGGATEVHGISISYY